MKNYPPNFLDNDQDSPEWLQSRYGHVTASRVADVLATRKRGEGELAARKTYRRQLQAEILKRRATDHFVTEAMQFGKDNEPLARNAYEEITGLEVDQVGFVLHPRIDRCGASPDGLVSDSEGDGGLEIKIPNTETFIDWKISGVVPEEHKPQMFLNMACCERDKPVKWWDFFAYDPRLDEQVNKFKVRLYRDDEYIADMEAKIVKFTEELIIDFEGFLRGASLESKLRASIRQAKGYPFKDAAEAEAFYEEIVP